MKVITRVSCDCSFILLFFSWFQRSKSSQHSQLHVLHVLHEVDYVRPLVTSSKYRLLSLEKIFSNLRQVFTLFLWYDIIKFQIDAKDVLKWNCRDRNEMPRETKCWMKPLKLSKKHFQGCLWKTTKWVSRGHEETHRRRPGTEYQYYFFLCRVKVFDRL